MSEAKRTKIEMSSVSETATYGKFVWEPLPRGYGITLGNSLRRILLSSLPGTAVTSIQIEGVLHEFSTITGVREDVTDIVLNIKQLRLATDEDEPCVIRINAETPGTVTGEDVICPDGIEVLNPDLYIATLEKGAKLNILMNVERGTGYISADRNKRPDMPIGEIPIDSIYTPVLRVNYDVTDTRVGNVTNYDKLSLDVWTDGSITPRNALGRSAEILIDYMQQVTTLAGIEVKQPDLVTDAGAGSGIDATIPIDDVEFSVRARNCLSRIGITHMQQLSGMSENDLHNIKNAGKKTIEDIKAKCYQLEIPLKPKTDD